MEVICFGLSLPLSEHDIIKDCVNVYCEWLSVLLPTPKVCVPQPVRDDPNIYSRKIITHFHHLFVPRKGEGKTIQLFNNYDAPFIVYLQYNTKYDLHIIMFI